MVDRKICKVIKCSARMENLIFFFPFFFCKQ